MLFLSNSNLKYIYFWSWWDRSKGGLQGIVEEAGRSISYRDQNPTNPAI